MSVRHALWLAALCSACTYEPPARTAEDYENAESYEDDSATHPRREELQAYLDEAVREGLPGAVLLVRSPDEGTWAGAAGWADIANRVPFQPTMIARVGSVSKMLTAALMLALCEEQGISLDDPVRPYLSGEIAREIENARTATFRQMLSHTSGIFDYVESTDLLFEGLGSYDYDYQPKERMLEYAYGRDAEFSPGAGWAYTSTPFLLLEVAAERIASKPSEALMRERVIEPLGLRSTSYAPSAGAPPGLVRGYADIFADGALIDTTDSELERFHFDGGVVSNVYDLADFLEALLHGPLLSDPARGALLDEVDTRGNSKRGTDFYGLGLIIEHHPQLGRVLGHSGTAIGYSAHVYHLEDRGITFAALVNGSQHGIEERSYRWFSPLKHDDILRLVTGEP